MEITAGKFYKTRSGRKVRVYSTEGCLRGVHGAIFTDNTWSMMDWYPNGGYVPQCGSPNDIVAEWEDLVTKTVTGYASLWSHNSVTWVEFSSKPPYQQSILLGAKKFEITLTEGEFDV